MLITMRTYIYENIWFFLTIQSFVFPEYLEVFEYFGQDKYGRISTAQLRQAMRMVGLNPTDHQIQALINEKEFDGKGFTTEWMYHFFLQYLCSVCAVDENRKQIIDSSSKRIANLSLVDLSESLPNKKFDMVVEFLLSMYLLNLLDCSKIWA